MLDASDHPSRYSGRRLGCPLKEQNFNFIRSEQKEQKMSTAAVNEDKGILVIPFAVEIDHPRNDDVLLQSIVGCRLRSAIEGSRPAQDSRTGEILVPADQSKALATFPRTPGMILSVNPRNLTYEINDPLFGNDELCARITKFVRQRGISSSTIGGVKPQHGTLDVHRMKTLCREVIWLAQEGALRVSKGKLPEMEEVEELPGEFLLNPGSRVQNQQPQFESGWADWVQHLARNGG